MTCSRSRTRSRRSRPACRNPRADRPQRAAAGARWRPDDLDAYRCALEFYAYRVKPNAADHPKVSACSARTVELYPTYATAWAMLALVEIDRDRFGFSGGDRDGTALDRALDSGPAATRLDPEDARAWQALMTVHYLRREVAQGRAAGERALALNPNDLDLVGEFGRRLVLGGEWEAGTAMIRSVLRLDPGRVLPVGPLALDAFRQGRYEETLQHLDRGNQELWTSQALRTATLGKLGRLEEARAAAARLLKAGRPPRPGRPGIRQAQRSSGGPPRDDGRLAPGRPAGARRPAARAARRPAVGAARLATGPPAAC